MSEIARQISPLEAKVDRTHYAVERLFNTNGGPEGWLQSRSKVDDDRFRMIFNMLKEHKEEMDPLKEFIVDHKAQEEQRERDRATDAAALAATVKNSQWKSNRNLALATLVLGVLTLIKGCGPTVKAMLIPVPIGHSQLQQDSRIPRLTR